MDRRQHAFSALLGRVRAVCPELMDEVGAMASLRMKLSRIPSRPPRRVALRSVSKPFLVERVFN